MKLLRLSLIFGFIAGLPAWAVYAPVPEQDQGKAWTVDLMAGVSRDSNIFGAASGEISSTVFTAAPKISFNASLANQTFVSASYLLTLDHFVSRPGKKNLDSHALTARLAHAFTQSTTIDVSDNFTINKNPQSLLPGLGVVNSDQSFKNNEIDSSFTTSLTEKAGLTLKAQSVLFLYDNAKLGTSLDRTENLFGVSGDYAVLPELKGVGELRYQTIDYRDSGGNKDKTSEFFLAGADYTIAKKLTATGRVGFEHRHRDAERSETAPYTELTAKYDYAQGSYLTAGYVYTLEESSNVDLYTDTQVNRFFVNVQHSITALIAASGSLDWEPSQLKGRIGLPNVNETTTRFGLALSYLPTKNWTVSVSYDYDKTSSGDPTRELTRNRQGLNAKYSF